MRLDLVVANEGPFAMEAVRTAVRVEELGYDGLWLTDHVIGVDSYAPVYGSYWLEILTTLGYLAAATKKLRLGTGVLVLPYRDPVLTAKMLATIDQLSGGRVDLGVGTGWARSEFRALGVGDRHESRGAVTDETLDIMLRCWQGGDIGWDGKISSFRKITFTPTPLQQPRIPLWIGARGLAAAPARRAAKYADYWHPTAVTPEEVRIGGDRIDEAAGRKVTRTIRIGLKATTPTSEVIDKLAAFGEAGCVQAAIDFKTQEYAEYMDAAERLIAAAGALKK